MARRLELHEEFCEILGTRNVYFQPPESIALEYPGIKYSISGMDTKRANNKLYKNTIRYEVIVIDPDPDSRIPYDILGHFEMCNFDRWYTSDNLNHFVLTLYY